jgi:hypothetical protein
MGKFDFTPLRKAIRAVRLALVLRVIPEHWPRRASPALWTSGRETGHGGCPLDPCRWSWAAPGSGLLSSNPSGLRLPAEVTAKEDIALAAGQLANLTRTVAEMETQVRALYERAENQQARADQQRERTEVQQERIDLAARELAEVSARLQSAADALRASI